MLKKFQKKLFFNNSLLFELYDDFKEIQGGWVMYEFVEGAIREVDVIRTDKRNIPVYSFVARLDERAGYLSNGQKSYYINGIDACCLSDDIMDIIWRYELTGYEGSRTNDDDTSRNCLKISVIKTDGASFEILVQGDVDKRLDACAREIVELFDTYEYMKEAPKEPTVNVAGTWKCDELGLTFRFKNNSSYYCMNWPRVCCRGHYTTEGSKVVSTDLVDKWEDKGFLFRTKKIGEFSFFKMQDNRLYAFFDEMDPLEEAAIFRRS